MLKIDVLARFRAGLVLAPGVLGADLLTGWDMSGLL
jgi:hypothetical protein